MSVSPRFHGGCWTYIPEGGSPGGGGGAVQLARLQHCVSHEPADAELTIFCITGVLINIPIGLITWIGLDFAALFSPSAGSALELTTSHLLSNCGSHSKARVVNRDQRRVPSPPSVCDRPP